MGHRAKIWNKRNIKDIKKGYGHVNLSKWEEEAANQRDLNRFYRERKIKSLKERVRKFVVRYFLNRQNKKEVNEIC